HADLPHEENGRNDVRASTRTCTLKQLSSCGIATYLRVVVVCYGLRFSLRVTADAHGRAHGTEQADALASRTLIHGQRSVAARHHAGGVQRCWGDFQRTGRHPSSLPADGAQQAGLLGHQPVRQRKRSEVTVDGHGAAFADERLDERHHHVLGQRPSLGSTGMLAQMREAIQHVFSRHVRSQPKLDAEFVRLLCHILSERASRFRREQLRAHRYVPSRPVGQSGVSHEAVPNLRHQRKPVGRLSREPLLPAVETQESHDFSEAVPRHGVFEKTVSKPVRPEALHIRVSPASHPAHVQNGNKRFQLVDGQTPRFPPGDSVGLGNRAVPNVHQHAEVEQAHEAVQSTSDLGFGVARRSPFLRQNVTERRYSTGRGSPLCSVQMVPSRPVSGALPRPAAVFLVVLRRTGGVTATGAGSGSDSGSDSDEGPQSSSLISTSTSEPPSDSIGSALVIHCSASS
ncbi:hypothetical protein ANANG_G00160540, partial [Anguilla anguilla]